MAIRLGLIGFGTVGRAVGQAVRQGIVGDAAVIAVLVRSMEKHREDALLCPWRFTDEPQEFFAEEIDVVVEMAGHAALRAHAVESLRRGKDLIAVSVGAFADEKLLAGVQEAAERAGRRVLVPSGALGGLDAVAAAALGGLDEVTITTRKPPEAWIGTVAERHVELSKVDRPVCLYSGPAREAALLYPQNVNVQAALGLAGVGLDRTLSRVYADPGVRHNTHEILARGYFGEIRITIANVPSEGSPKTGRIVALSVIRTIRLLTDPVAIGL